MTIPLLELAAAALGDLVGDLVFVGGATLEILVTDSAAPPARPTEDVDVVVQAASRYEYERFAKRLRARGFSEDATSSVICRWKHSGSEIHVISAPYLLATKLEAFGDRGSAVSELAPVTGHLPVVLVAVM